MLDSTLTQQPAMLQLLASFQAGIISSLSPCVYPMIPITLALFGATDEVPRKKSFLLAVTYVLGICTTYTILGMISAKTGALFGASLSRPVVVIPIVLLLFLLALFTLEIFHFKGAYKMQSAASGIGGKGFAGAFLMGSVSGLVFAPCVGPVLVIVLGVAAASPNPLWGASLLFSYSLGLGLLFLMLGMFPALARKLPRSGNWLHYVKFLIAVALLIAALTLLAPLLQIAHYEVSAIAIAGAAVLFVLCMLAARAAYRKDIGWLKGVSACLLASVLFFVGAPIIKGQNTAESTAGASAQVVWKSSLSDAFQEAKVSGRKVFVDLRADWCAACKELEEQTFPTAAAQEALRRFVLARIDLTDTSTPENEAIQQKYQVLGLPCLMILDANGNELPGTRINGFLPANEFTQALAKVP